jgi:hypothetical protein
MNRIDEILQQERAFQSWFARVWDAHHESNRTYEYLVSAGDPLSGRYSLFNYQFKQTVRIPPAYNGDSFRFRAELVRYCVENAIALYGSSIRISTTESRCNIFKNCGHQVGSCVLTFEIEGNMVSVGMGYQIYKINHINGILAHPSTLLACERNNIRKSEGFQNLRYLTGVKRVKNLFIGLILCFFAMLLACDILFSLLVPTAKREVFFSGGICCSAFPIFAGWCIVGPYYVSLRQKYAAWDYALHQFSLSPLHFTTAFLSDQEVNKALALSSDHQAYWKRLSSIVDKATALGEQSQIVD